MQCKAQEGWWQSVVKVTYASGGLVHNVHGAAVLALVEVIAGVVLVVVGICIVAWREDSGRRGRQ